MFHSGMLPRWVIGLGAMACLFGGGQVYAQGHPQDFMQTTTPLKSGGTMTSLTQQGQKHSWVNQPGRTNLRQRETGFNTNFSNQTSSFYRQAQGGAYPYPGGNRGEADRTSQYAQGQTAQLSYTRGQGPRATGEIGRTDGAPAVPAAASEARRAAPPERLAQLPDANGATLPLPTAALPRPLPGPNYVNPAQNFQYGYQGYQAGAISANSVPALNARVPAARYAQANCCNPSPQCSIQCQPQVPAYQPYGNQAPATQPAQFRTPAFQMQPNIGVPQLGGNVGGNLGAAIPGLLAGSGKYTPLLQFRNMPPGTYLGQGVIGQPTAYVDGQPFRNLLRYVSP